MGKNKAEALKLQLSNFWGVKSESFGVKVEEANVATLCGSADLVVDAFDNAKSRRTLSAWARSANKHLPLIAAVSSTLARAIQDFVAKATKRDAMISLSGVTTTAE